MMDYKKLVELREWRFIGVEEFGVYIFSWKDSGGRRVGCLRL